MIGKDIEKTTNFVNGSSTMTEQILSSCSGAVLTSILVTPLDVVKIRLQVQEKKFAKKKCFLYYNGLWDHVCFCCDQNKSKTKSLWYRRPGVFNGTFDAFFKIAKNEGITSLWSGLPHTLVMAVPATILYFTIYEQIRDTTYSYLNNKTPILWVPMVSGMFSRVITVTTVSPLEFIRIKAQSENIKYSDMWKSISSLVKHKGVFSLWHGLIPTLLRDVPFSGIYWSTYEGLKRNFNDSSNNAFLSTFLSGAIAGSVAATVTTPFDVIKTHRQIELGEADILMKSSKLSTYQVIKNLYNSRGISSLFAGLFPRLVKIAPACAIMISSYEFGKIYFKNKKIEVQ